MSTRMHETMLVTLTLSDLSDLLDAKYRLLLEELSFLRQDLAKALDTRSAEPQGEQKLLTVRDVMIFIGRSEPFVLDALKHGVLHGAKIGGHWRITKPDLDEYVKRCAEVRVKHQKL